MRPLVRLLLASAALVAVAARVATADVPTVLARGSAGPFDVTVVAPAPLSPGRSEWIVWLAGPEDDPPARIAIEVDGARSVGVAPGAVAVHLHRVGRIPVRMSLERGDARGRLEFEVVVDAPPGLSSHWRALALAPLGLVAFVLHQWRVLRTASPRGRPRAAS